mmetsp:Transcript_68696/g.114167  ORF Transcript_68696/g.114167 Transcript_68696/m.114167 type:complete len:1503 (+) Transcript_68696:61-4569(+)
MIKNWLFLNLVQLDFLRLASNFATHPSNFSRVPEFPEGKMSLPPAVGTCPLTYPFAYRTCCNFDYCCKTASTTNRQLRGDICQGHQFTPCPSPPCKDNPQGAPGDEHNQFAGEGTWRLVRRVKPGYSWHPALDQLSGVASYGSPCGPSDDCTFSIPWASADYDRFLFMTGDGDKWLVADKQQVTGGLYANADRQIVSSSSFSGGYTAKWYRRSGAFEDPWISLSDHGSAIGRGEILYGANSYPGPHASNVLPVHNGANVFINARRMPQDDQVPTGGWTAQNLHRGCSLPESEGRILISNSVTSWGWYGKSRDDCNYECLWRPSCKAIAYRDWDGACMLYNSRATLFQGGAVHVEQNWQCYLRPKPTTYMKKKWSTKKSPVGSCSNLECKQQPDDKYEGNLYHWLVRRCLGNARCSAVTYDEQLGGCLRECPVGFDAGTSTTLAYSHWWYEKTAYQATIFSSIDTSGDGFLSLSEMTDAVKTIGHGDDKCVLGYVHAELDDGIDHRSITAAPGPAAVQVHTSTLTSQGISFADCSSADCSSPGTADGLVSAIEFLEEVAFVYEGPSSWVFAVDVASGLDNCSPLSNYGRRLSIAGLEPSGALMMHVPKNPMDRSSTLKYEVGDMTKRVKFIERFSKTVDLAEEAEAQAEDALVKIEEAKDKLQVLLESGFAKAEVDLSWESDVETMMTAVAEDAAAGTCEVATDGAATGICAPFAEEATGSFLGALGNLASQAWDDVFVPAASRVSHQIYRATLEKIEDLARAAQEAHAVLRALRTGLKRDYKEQEKNVRKKKENSQLHEDDDTSWELEKLKEKKSTCFFQNTCPRPQPTILIFRRQLEKHYGLQVLRGFTRRINPVAEPRVYGTIVQTHTELEAEAFYRDGRLRWKGSDGEDEVDLMTSKITYEETEWIEVRHGGTKEQSSVLRRPGENRHEYERYLVLTVKSSFYRPSGAREPLTTSGAKKLCFHLVNPEEEPKFRKHFTWEHVKCNNIETVREVEGSNEKRQIQNGKWDNLCTTHDDYFLEQSAAQIVEKTVFSSVTFETGYDGRFSKVLDLDVIGSTDIGSFAAVDITYESQTYPSGIKREATNPFLMISRYDRENFIDPGQISTDVNRQIWCQTLGTNFKPQHGVEAYFSYYSVGSRTSINEMAQRFQYLNEGIKIGGINTLRHVNDWRQRFGKGLYMAPDFLDTSGDKESGLVTAIRADMYKTYLEKKEYRADFDSKCPTHYIAYDVDLSMDENEAYTFDFTIDGYGTNSPWYVETNYKWSYPEKYRNNPVSPWNQQYLARQFLQHNRKMLLQRYNFQGTSLGIQSNPRVKACLGIYKNYQEYCRGWRLQPEGKCHIHNGMRGLAIQLRQLKFRLIKFDAVIEDTNAATFNFDGFDRSFQGRNILWASRPMIVFTLPLSGQVDTCYPESYQQSTYQHLRNDKVCPGSDTRDLVERKLDLQRFEMKLSPFFTGKITPAVVGEYEWAKLFCVATTYKKCKKDPDFMQEFSDDLIKLCLF